MNKIKILNITFDTKVKILIVICVCIAVIIIAYSFYYICIKEKGESNYENIDDINSLLNISNYEAEYNICITGNKTINNYNIKENVDLKNKIYNMLIDDSLNITINSSNTKITKENMEYEYQAITNNEIINSNAVSFSSIIECVKKILNKEISGNIVKVEQDNRNVYKINTENEYIKNINKIDIIIDKQNCKIIEIKMYNKEEKELYSMDFVSFIVKK